MYENRNDGPAKAVSPELQAAIDQLEKRIEERRERYESLPCQQVTDGERVSSCLAGKHHRGCAYRADGELCALTAEEKSQQEWDNHLEAAQVPEKCAGPLRTWRRSRQGMIKSEAVAAVVALLDGKAHPVVKPQHHWLAMTGQTSRGKTYAASYALARLGGRYVLAQEVLDLDMPHGPLLRAPVLVVDQMGFEYSRSDWGRSRLGTLLDKRYGQVDAYTILCCNCTQKDFRSRYGSMLWERFNEVGAWVEVGGPNLREEAARRAEAAQEAAQSRRAESAVRDGAEQENAGEGE